MVLEFEITWDKDDKEWIFNNEKIEMDTMPFDYKGVYYEVTNDEVFTNLPIETVIGQFASTG